MQQSQANVGQRIGRETDLPYSIQRKKKALRLTSCSVPVVTHADMVQPAAANNTLSS